MKKSTSAKGFVNSLVVNGQTLEQKAKQIVTTINGQEVSLNCTYIADIELDEAYTSNFSVTHQDKVIEVHYTKVGNRVSASIYINDKLAFSSISVQAVFTVLNAA